MTLKPDLTQATVCFNDLDMPELGIQPIGAVQLFFQTMLDKMPTQDGSVLGS